jgi:hypothetical protein
VRLARVLENELPVAFQVADGGINLSKRDVHRSIGDEWINRSNQMRHVRVLFSVPIFSCEGTFYFPAGLHLRFPLKALTGTSSLPLAGCPVPVPKIVCAHPSGRRRDASSNRFTKYSILDSGS